MAIITPPSLWDTVSHQALDKVASVPYGWGQAIYVGLRDIALKRFNIKLPKKNLENEICSEFVADVYQLADTCVSPGDLYDELTSLGCTNR